jgi:hypothetical protein
MHVTRFKPSGDAEDVLRRSREGLLTFLAEHLRDRFSRATVVFDSTLAPRHLPAELQWNQLEVFFARNHSSADEMIQQLIRESPLPKKLVVVSSDHQIQVAATRRRAIAIDSDDWFDALVLPARPASEANRPSVDRRIEEQAQAELANEDWEEMIADETASDRERKINNPFPDGYFDDLGIHDS